MTKKRYIVDLTSEEREQAIGLTRKGKVSTRKVTRARILLKADEGWTDEQIVAALDTSLSTVERTRKRLVEGGLQKALNDDPRPGAGRKLDGRGEAYLIALTCSEPPEDHDHWALRQTLKKTGEALAGTAVVYAQRQRRLRSGHGAGAGCV